MTNVHFMLLEGVFTGNGCSKANINTITKSRDGIYKDDISSLLCASWEQFIMPITSDKSTISNVTCFFTVNIWIFIMLFTIEH